MAPGDKRRDAGFTIFYMGINLGSTISQFFAPLLAVWFGWWAGFGLAAAGMVIAWALFQFDGGRLSGYGEPPADSNRTKSLLVMIGALAAIPVAWFLLQNSMASAEAAAAAAKSGAGFMGYLASLPLLGKVMFVTFTVAVIGIPIWAYMARQQGRVSAHGRGGHPRRLHRRVLDAVRTGRFVADLLCRPQHQPPDRQLSDAGGAGADLQPAVHRHHGAGDERALGRGWASAAWSPSTPVKFAIGLLLVGAGFLFLVFGTRFAGPDYKVALFWLAGLYFIQTIGELCLSPVGLSHDHQAVDGRVSSA